MLEVHPILAIDPGAIVGLIVLVLSVLGWLVNLIKGEDGAPKAPPPRQANAGGKNLRSEIQDFLDELTVTRDSDVRKPRRPRVEEEDVIVLEEDEPVQKPTRPAKTGKPRKKEKPAPQRVAPAPPARQISQVPQQHLQTSRLGTGVQEHVATHMAAGQVTAKAQAFIGHRVEQAVQHDLGASPAAAGAVPNLSVAKLHPALTFLGQPGAIRDGIIISEILQPPKALRGRPR